MASFNYYLKRAKAPRKTAIILQITYEGLRPRLNTGISIEPGLWNEEKRRLDGNAVWIEKTNRRLVKIEGAARDVFIAYQEENNDEFPPPKVLMDLITEKLKRKTKAQRVTFFSFFQQVIDQQMKRIANEGKGYRESSVPSYVNALNAVKDYAKHRKKRVDFDTITIEFYWDFLEYLQEVKGMTYNTRGMRIKFLRAVLRRAQSAGIKLYVDLEEFKGFSKQADTIALTETELEEMAKLELDDSLSQMRDMFLIGAWTGLRISDWSKVNRENIRGNMIHLTVKKTGRRLVLPLHPIVKYLLEKYNYELPKFADQHVNRSLKTIGGILAEKSKHQTLENKKEKYAKITSHVARRSFATNFYYRRVPIDTIRAVTGHSTERAFLTYLRVSPEDHASNLGKYMETDVVPFKEAK